MSELLEPFVFVFNNFKSDYLALLNSSLPIVSDFSKIYFYDIQKFYVRNSGNSYKQPIGLENLSKLFLLKPLYKDKYEEILKLNNEINNEVIDVKSELDKLHVRHNPLTDANITLKLFFLIPERMRYLCRLKFDDFLNVIRNYNKAMKKRNALNPNKRFKE